MLENEINTEFLVTNFLLKSVSYTKKVIPYLDPSYFQLLEYQRIIKVIKAFYLKYEKLPPVAALIIYFKEREKSITEQELQDVLIALKALSDYKENNFAEEYLLEITEEYFRKRALFNAIVESEEIYQSKPNDVNLIPDILQKALQVCFNTSIGHDYFEDQDAALEFYHQEQFRFPTHLKNLNRVLGGGFVKGKLNVILGQPGGGKSRFLVDICSHYLKQGLNCLFVTLELSKMDIRQRFDANIMDIGINDLPQIETEKFVSKLKYLKTKSYGKLIIEHFSAGSVNCNHIRNLVEELKLKKNFIPDVIAIDYIALLNPVIPTHGKLYETGFEVSKNLKKLFDDYNVIGFAPNQLNRSGWGSSDVMMNNIADSAAIMHNADFCASITGSEQLLDENKFLFIILKNRLYKLSKNRKVVIGYDDDKMRHFDVSQEDTIEQGDIPQTEKKFNKSVFDSFNF